MGQGGLTVSEEPLTVCSEVGGPGAWTGPDGITASTAHPPPPVQMSSGMSQLIGLKEKGLPHIARLLQSGNSDVVRSGASLLSNMSRHPALHRVMGE